MRRLLTGVCFLLVLAPAAVASKDAAPPTCTRNSSYPVPGALQLDGSRTGVTTVAEPVDYYRVYGNTVAQILRQAAMCAPAVVAGYLAYASWYFNWSFLAGRLPDGNCKLTSVAVGVHTAEVLPRWTPGPSAAGGLAQKWTKFAGALATHEQGHLQRAVQGAQKILHDMQSMGEVSCTTLNSSVNGVGQRDLNAITETERQYDVQTDHGATQGAVLAGVLGG